MAEKPLTELYHPDFPALLREIPDPPQKLFVRGTLPDDTLVWLCVVGSRKFSSYGASACRKLIQELAGYPVVIVSGLALGIDAVAHQAALNSGLVTVAVPGSGIDDTALYPRAHVGLARKILEEGGALLSECAPQDEATVWSFPKRNRIMAGLCHATLIIEAHEKSGTLITARLALEYNRDVLIVPGPITSPNGTGSNRLLREGGQAVTCGADVLQALHIETAHDMPVLPANVSPDERVILEALSSPKTADELSSEIGIPVSHINMLVSMLELKRVISVRLGKIERCV
ncbi:MAG: hypothetical protein AMXMBFR44_4940 [Candidatus Campbellbacteria bacterium]